MTTMERNVNATDENQNGLPMDLSRPGSTETFYPPKSASKSVLKEAEICLRMVQPTGDAEETKPVHISRSPLTPLDANLLPPKKHKPANEAVTPEENCESLLNDGVMCEDCQIRLTSLTSLREHQLGRRHMMVINAKRLKTTNDTCDLDMIEDEKDQKFSSLSASGGPGSFQEEVKGVPKMHNQCITMGKLVKDASGFTPHIPYFCHICNVPITNRSAIEAHIKGRRHRAMLLNREQEATQSFQTTESAADASSLGYPRVPSRSESDAPAVVSKNDGKQLFVDNWVSNVSQTVSESPVPFDDKPVGHLDTRAVLRRVCLTQILSLMQPMEQRGLPQASSISEERLWSMINTRCIDMLLANDTRRNEDQSCTTGTLPPDRVMQSMLLLSWCQQLSFLQS